MPLSVVDLHLYRTHQLLIKQRAEESDDDD